MFARAARFVRRCCCVGITFLPCTLLIVTTARAQPPEPIGRYALDLRGAIPFLPTDPRLAEARDTGQDRLPRFGWGLDVGAHVYPFRWKAITFGVGASYHQSRGQRTPPVPDGSTAPPGPTVSSRFNAVSPQVSFNFGHNMGWSYVSGGLGRSTFRAWRSDAVEDEGVSIKTINYGGGARWFVNPHVAVNLDLRFYALNSGEPTPMAFGHPRMTFAVASGGVSIR